MKKLFTLTIFFLIIAPALFAQQLLVDLNKSTSDSSRLRILTQLGELYQKRRHGKNAEDLDSARYYILKALILSKNDRDTSKYGRGQLLIRLGKITKYQNKSAESATYFKQGIAYFHGNHQIEGEAKALESIGIYLCDPQNDPRVREYLSKASKLYARLNKPEKMIYVEFFIAYDRYYASDYDGAEKICNNLFGKFENTKYGNLDLVYFLMANINRYKGNFNKALYYALKGVKRMEFTNNTSQAGTVYGELAEVYQALGDIDNSLIYYKKCIEAREKLNMPQQFILRTAGFVVQMMITRHRAAEGLKYITDMAKRHPPDSEFEAALIAQIKGQCYEALNSPVLAEKNYQVMIKTLGNDSTGIGVEARFDLVNFYVNQKRFKQAEVYLRSLVAENVLMAGKMELIRFKIDSAAGNLKTAIDHYQHYKVINDSIFSESKTKQIQQLQVEYESEKKDKDIKLLKSESLTQKSKVQQANYMRNITLGGIVVLMLFLALLYNSYRFKQRKNETLNKLVIEKDGLLIEKDNLLLEKQWLLKEIHHRVKNNLAIVMGLLNRQSAYIDNEVALVAIQNSQNRMRSIALIHQKLYQSDNLDLILMPEYIDDLINHLKDSFDLGTRIIFEKQIDEIHLDVSQAVPLGLIINEAITNAIKYAYPGQTQGIIQIFLLKKNGAQNLLQIKDNGQGLPVGFDPKKIKSMGMNLIRGLSKQLGGKFEMFDDNGVLIKIEFQTEVFITTSSTTV